MGRVAALGASLRNACIVKQERESTIELCEPGMCCPETKRLYVAASKNGLRSTCII